MIQIDIEMPKTCGQCFCAMEDYDYNTVRCRFKYDLCFDANSRDYSNRRLDGCPLHEITDSDTISRQTVLDALQKHFNPTGAELSPDLASVLAGVGVVINTIPPSPSRPHGHWIKHHESRAGIVYSCDRCGRTLQALSWETRKDVCKMYPFCHCGADMRS